MRLRRPQRTSGIVFVLSGPSGSGKGSVLRPVISEDDNLQYSVSATTRRPREGEVHGREYWFLDPQEFEEMVSSGAMLEHAEYAGNRYGTPRAPVEQAIAAGRDVLLEIEIQGAQQVREAVPDAVMVLLLPPSASELSERLRRRGTDTDAAIARREAAYPRELAAWPIYDYIIINDVLERATAQFRAILEAERCRVTRLDVQGFIERNYGGV